MNVSEAIEKRKSVRKFLDKPVEDEKVKEIIEYAGKAPSGNNAQPWRFYVVKKGEITQRMKDEEIFLQALAYEAPIMIVCCSDPQAYTNGTGKCP